MKIDWERAVRVRTREEKTEQGNNLVGEKKSHLASLSTEDVAASRDVGSTSISGNVMQIMFLGLVVKRLVVTISWC